MVEINLLPKEKKPKASVVRLSRTLRKLLNVIAVVFFTVAVVVAGAYFFFSDRVKEVKGKYEETKKQIVALEQTEQRYFLLQERLKKIEKIKNSEDVLGEVDILKDVLGYFQEDMVFTVASLSENEVKLTVYIKNAFDLTKLINDLKEKGSFDVVTLESLGFSPEVGYECVFVLSR